MMQASQIKKLGDALFDALTACTTLPPLTSQHAGITVDDAYAIQ